jgi:hypothetical protein
MPWLKLSVRKFLITAVTRIGTTAITLEHVNLHGIVKIRDFHCSDYEECRLVGYKNPVHT